MKYRILVNTSGYIQEPLNYTRKKGLDLWSGTPQYLGRALKERFSVVRETPGKRPQRGRGAAVDFVFFENTMVREPDKWDYPYVLYNDFVCKSYFREKTPWFPIGRNSLPIEIRSFQCAAAIFTFSDYARNSIIKDYGIDAAKVFTVGAGPNFNRLPVVRNKPFDGKTILFIGRDIKRKGGATLLEAFPIVKKHIPAARLVMVSSDLEKEIQGHGRNLKKLGIIVYKCADKRLLGHLYRQASVFAMPSLYEPFGMVFLEAMAYKLPCIGTSKCAMPEIITDGKTGFLVKPNDTRGLARRLIYLLQHKDVARAMGERGRARIEQYYRWDLVVKRIEERMRTVLGGR